MADETSTAQAEPVAPDSGSAPEQVAPEPAQIETAATGLAAVTASEPLPAPVPETPPTPAATGEDMTTAQHLSTDAKAALTTLIDKLSEGATPVVTTVEDLMGGSVTITKKNAATGTPLPRSFEYLIVALAIVGAISLVGLGIRIFNHGVAGLF